MIIECELLNRPQATFVESEWSHDLSDPLVVRVEFLPDGPTWEFSLDLLMEALTVPEEGLHGSAYFLVEAGENFTIVHLSDGQKATSLQFSTADIQSFLNGIPEPAYDEIIARKLDEFLETL